MMTDQPSKRRQFGRDRRRRLSIDELRQLYADAEGRCEKCGCDLGADWHAAHLVAWTNGGATELENMQAWCQRCNLAQGTDDVSVVPLELRTWQQEALPAILDELYRSGRATLHAAPGAGKTIFVGAVYARLAAAGLVDRLVVVVPNRVLLGQWKRELATNFGIYVDDHPRDGWMEHPDTVGLVITYAGCLGAAEAHRRALTDMSTLVVFDEVHHLADQRSWGKAAQAMIHDDAGRRIATVLNTTGTLFRSTGNEQIPTVRYHNVTVGHRRMVEAVADVSVTADRLIGRELRPVDLLTCGSQVELIDLVNETVVSGEVADLDDPHHMRAAHARMVADPEWMDGFARHMLDRLAAQTQTLEGDEHLKALWVARDQRTARAAAAIINKAAGLDFARLVISDESGALHTLERAIRDPKPCCIVAVQMVTEGFDCAQLSTIAYAGNITAELFLTQMVARAMRPTPVERANGRFLPTQVLIPDVADLRQAFVDVLVAKLHMIDYEETEKAAISDDGRGGLRLPRYDLTQVTIPRLDDVEVIGEDEGRVTRPEVESMGVILTGLGLGAGAASLLAPRAVVAARQYHERHFLRDRVRADIKVDHLDPRSLNVALRDRAQLCSGWWAHRGDTNIAQFQSEANMAAGIDPGGRDNARPEQLRALVAYMDREIRRRCTASNFNVPRFLDDEVNDR